MYVNFESEVCSVCAYNTYTMQTDCSYRLFADIQAWIMKVIFKFAVNIGLFMISLLDQLPNLILWCSSWNLSWGPYSTSLEPSCSLKGSRCPGRRKDSSVFFNQQVDQEPSLIFISLGNIKKQKQTNKQKTNRTIKETKQQRSEWIECFTYFITITIFIS